MSGKAKLAGALGVAELLETDLKQPLPVSPKEALRPQKDGPKDGGYPKSAELAGTKSSDKRKIAGVGEPKVRATVAPASQAARLPEKSAAGYAKPDLPVAPATSSGKGGGKSNPELPGANKKLPGESGSAAQSSPKNDISPNAQCTISEGYGPAEIRTKVFRIGAPLLRSTIPVTLGGKKDVKPMTKVEGDEKDSSDVETILSLSDGEGEAEGQLSVTLDFPC
eukprot:Skav205695  [mRNA]  locus=scaffold2655:199518:200186:- [translate_table: standard]